MRLPQSSDAVGESQQVYNYYTAMEIRDLGDALEGNGAGHRSQGISIKTFVASLVTAIIVFAIETLLFMLLKGKLKRI